ncbi:MAG: TonB-dependent receptor, partial [Bacteroidales bacterium]|nr:TonB-dependent receptor [Bacteroidales bacterium]
MAQHPGGKGKPDFNATNGLIKGRVIDNKTKKPVEYANISLFSYRDSTLKAGTITNSDGIFTLDNLHYGKYYLKVDFIGYKSKIIPGIKVMPKMPTVFLGDIGYEPSVNKLDEVTISDSKSLVEYKLDKKIINVEQDISSIGGNAIDVLKNVPSIQVDMDDNVSIRGSSNITILIDGKRSAFASSSDVLQQIPTSAIASIELITNPSAKFDPDGLSGIINIIMKKNKKKGVNLTVSANGGTSQRYGGSVDFNIRIAKFNFFTSYNLRNNMREFSGYTDQTNYFDNDSVIYLTQKAHKQRTRFSQSFRGGIDFYPNDNNTISLSSSFRLGNHSSNGFTNYLDKDINDVTWSYFDTDNSDESDNNSLELSLDWEKKFNNPEHKLTADITYSTKQSDDSGYLDNYFTIYDMLPSDSIYSQQNFTTDSHQFSSAQMDYVHPFNEFTKLEAGVKSSIDNYDDDYLFQDFNSLTNGWENDT